MDKLTLPDDFNYLAAFLTFSCQLRCSYCINHHGGDLVKGRHMSPTDWITALDRLPLSSDRPITLQGGEPTAYRGFYELVAHKPLWGQMDLLTNLELDDQVFMSKVPPEAFRRSAPYASIRVSWHIGQNSGPELLRRVERMLKRGYQVGIWAVDHPEHTKELKEAQLQAWAMGIDFRMKEFLGPWGGKDHGTLRYPNAVNAHDLRGCMCRTSELLIAPDGNIFRCHSDLYAARGCVGRIFDERLDAVGKWLGCNVYGKCNSCDIKVKTNRHQVHGHSSVEVKDVREPWGPNNDYVNEVVNTYGKADSKSTNQTGEHS